MQCKCKPAQVSVTLEAYCKQIYTGQSAADWTTNKNTLLSWRKIHHSTNNNHRYHIHTEEVIQGTSKVPFWVIKLFL